MNFSLGHVVLLMLAALLLSSRLARALATPLVQISQAVQALQDGRLETRRKPLMGRDGRGFLPDAVERLVFLHGGNGRRGAGIP